MNMLTRTQPKTRHSGDERNPYSNTHDQLPFSLQSSQEVNHIGLKQGTPLAYDILLLGNRRGCRDVIWP